MFLMSNKLTCEAKTGHQTTTCTRGLRLHSLIYTMPTRIHDSLMCFGCSLFDRAIGVLIAVLDDDESKI